MVRDELLKFIVVLNCMKLDCEAQSSRDLFSATYQSQSNSNVIHSYKGNVSKQEQNSDDK